MLNRWIGILAAAAMLVANGAIIIRDLVPDWLAGDPPPPGATRLAPGERRADQVGIFDRENRLIGRSWTVSHRTETSWLVVVDTVTVLNPFTLPQGMRTPAVCIQTRVTYREQQTRVDELELQMFGLGVPIHFYGEAYETGDFPCQWQVGPRRGWFVLDSEAPAALGDVIRPFDRLPNLYVGRTWRLDLLDPLAQILPNVKATGLGFDSVLIRVTGQETITHRGRQIETFVVESSGATAWVAPDGRVLRQQVNLPLLGQLTLRDEELDEDTLRDAIAPFPVEVQLGVRRHDEP